MTQEQQQSRLALAVAPHIKQTKMTPWSPTFGELVQQLTQPPLVGAKDGSYFLCCQAPQRNSKTCKQLPASVLVLDGDSRIDPDTGQLFKGAPDPAAVHRALRAMHLEHVIASSHSNGMTEPEVVAENKAKQLQHAEALKKNPRSQARLSLVDTGGAYGAELHRYRVIVPCTHTEDERASLNAWLIAQLHAAGVMLAAAPENDDYAHAWFLPRVPDEARQQLWRSYVHAEDDAHLAAHALRRLREGARSLAENGPQPQPQPQLQLQLPAPQSPSSAERSPIDEFNAKVHAMPDGFSKLLESYGYTPAERAPDGTTRRWAKPGSGDDPGVTLLLDCADSQPRVFSHHANDPLHGEPRDPFDCYRILACNGDQAVALRWSPDIDAHNAAVRAARAADNYFAPGEEIITVQQAVMEARGALAGIRAAAKPDPGALHDPRLVGWLAVIKHHDAAEWARIEADLCELAKGPQLTAVKRAVDACNASRQAAVAKRQIEARLAAAAGSSALRRWSADVVAPGFLVTLNSKGDPVLVKESVAADRMAPHLVGLLAFDITIGCWYQFTGKQWELLSGEHGPSAVLQDLARIGCADVVGYSAGWLAGVTKLLEGSARLVVPQWNKDVLPFLNGILDLSTSPPTLSPTTPDNAQDWCLPHNYEPGARCPTVQRWLLDTMDGDIAMAHFLRCAAAAVLRGRLAQLQVFLHLLGAGGSGKSTLLELLSAMVGKHSCVTTSMSAMESRPFEVAAFKGARIVTVGDMEEWTGKVATLKSLTGRDELRFEHKGKQRQAAGDFIYEGSVIILSNSALRGSDKSDGLQRRRRTVIFSEKFSDDARLRWLGGGGNSQLLRELPGFINWLLDLTVAEIDAAIMTPPAGVMAANDEAAKENNSVAAWFDDCCEPSEGQRLRVGARREVTIHAPLPGGGGTRSYRIFENAETHAYPNYLTWCVSHGVHHPASHVTFATSVLHAMQAAGYPVSPFKDKRKDKHGAYIEGVKLKATI